MSYQLKISDLGEVVLTGSLTSGKVADLVTLAEAKNYLKQSYSSISAEDALIATMIQSARKWIENYIGKSIIEKSIIAFTSDELAEFELPLPPVASITSVKRIDIQGVETTLTKNTDYYEIGVDHLSLIFLNVWSTISYTIAGIKVTYTAKMIDVRELDVCKQACLMLLGEMYYNRGESTDAAMSAIPFDVKRLLNPIRLMRTL